MPSAPLEPVRTLTDAPRTAEASLSGRQTAPTPPTAPAAVAPVDHRHTHRPTHRRRRRLVQALTGYAFLAPSLIGVGLFLVVPVIAAVVISFQDWDLISPATWVGWDNYVEVLRSPQVRNSLLVTIAFTVMVIPTQTGLGLFCAVLLHKKLPGSTFFRIVFAIPWICAPLTLGIVWKWIFAPTDGALNALLGVRIEWLSSLTLALPAVAAVNVWTHVGYVTLFFLAGLAAVPQDLQNAARLDGASETRLFWAVTVPLLRPTTFFVLATGIIGTFQAFDSIYAMTGGGPGVPGRTDVLAARIYYDAFESLDMGRAATLSVLLMILLVVLTVAQQRYFRRRITYDLS
ncbi:carbohydrate ABC transporter membrane protein 1, CUT1 family [Sanguibacter gelidistatuariae]|uniref:Carbohydrate ABC transporter membrane protein 1, CUT1 family n=1 Tax=Sanguibacter gelidistatuariae TaxID=1814289 RepID=A0A1G6HL06_9MICO|nr:sugar ABC transporter permease [Sanguibacter gelidistatuariae]SDB94585.1 carbohydrate ABC transporter membrane protein 1, CUT1 family [Sanguibacter gelidistatuariae]